MALLMGRRIALVALLLLAALITLALLLRKEPPAIPKDTDHLGALHRLGLAGSEKACLDCHGPAGRSPRGPKHPLANDCSRCHSLREG